MIQLNKIRKLFFAGVIATAVILGTANSSKAATNYWDTNGSTPGFGSAAGTWGSDAYWSNDSAGTTAPATTNTTTSDDLFFGSGTNGLAAGTVNVSGSSQGFKSITFGEASGEIIISGGSLNMAASNTVVTLQNSADTIGSSLTGGDVAFYGDSYNEFLTTTAAQIYQNVSLADYTSAEAICGGFSINVGKPAHAAAYFFTNDGTTASCQFQLHDDIYIKCVKVQFEQVGSNITAKALYAKYVHESNGLGYNFDTGGAGSSIATSYDSNGYGVAEVILLKPSGRQTLRLTGSNSYTGKTTVGICNLELSGSGTLGAGAYSNSIANNGNLVFNSSDDQTLYGGISGAGTLLKGPASLRQIVFTNFLTSSDQTVFYNETLADYTDAGGFIRGYYITDSITYAHGYYFVNNGTTATIQLQAENGSWTKCVKVQWTQNGSNIDARVVYAKYTGSGNLGFDFDTGGIGGPIATSPESNGYGVSMSLLAKHPVSSWLTLAGTNNTFCGGTTIKAGSVIAQGGKNSLPAKGGITVLEGAELKLNAGNLASNTRDGVGPYNPITVSTNGLLTISSDFNAGYQRKITVDGGILCCAVPQNPDGDNSNYMNNLALRNGARLMGKKIRVGFWSSAILRVEGTTPSYIESGISFVQYPGSSISLTLAINDVTSNSNSDLIISGELRDFPGVAYAGLHTIKTGEGTLELAGASTHKGVFTINDGTIALRNNGSINSDNDITLNGGTLDMGSYTNSAGVLTVSTNSTVVLGSGQLMFADSSTASWSGNLEFTGILGKQSIRFGTNDLALTAAQIQNIKLNGESVALTSAGWLKNNAGLRVIIR